MQCRNQRRRILKISQGGDRVSSKAQYVTDFSTAILGARKTMEYIGADLPAKRHPAKLYREPWQIKTLDSIRNGKSSPFTGILMHILLKDLWSKNR